MTLSIEACAALSVEHTLSGALHAGFGIASAASHQDSIENTLYGLFALTTGGAMAEFTTRPYTFKRA
jgi:hypothetical protein